MLKFSQAAPEPNAPPGGPPEPAAGGASPGGGGGLGGALGLSSSPFSGGGGPSAPSPSMPTPPAPPIYKPLESPADVFQDYNIIEHINGGKPAPEIAKEIWEQYGGDAEGLGIIGLHKGERKETDNPPAQNIIDEEMKRTEHSKWKRLKNGMTILDIFGSQDNISYLVYNYIKSEVSGKKAAAEGASWYRLALHHGL